MSYVVITQTITARETSAKHLDYVDASEIAWEIGYESIGDVEFVSVNVQCTICDQFNHHCRCIIPGCDPERASVMAFGIESKAYGKEADLDDLLDPGTLARFAEARSAASDAEPYPHVSDVTCTTCQRRFLTITPNHYQCAECEFPWLVSAVPCQDCGCLVPFTNPDRAYCDACYADRQG